MDRRYPIEGAGRAKLPRALERQLPDNVVLEEMEAAKGNPDRKVWLRKLRAEAKRRGIG